jgi:hypothetical protein
MTEQDQWSSMDRAIAARVLRAPITVKRAFRNGGDRGGKQTAGHSDAIAASNIAH